MRLLADAKDKRRCDKVPFVKSFEKNTLFSKFPAPKEKNKYIKIRSSRKNRPANIVKEIQIKFHGRALINEPTTEKKGK
jgi:hypothetical protein